jgi:hypothetical protein
MLEGGIVARIALSGFQRGLPRIRSLAAGHRAVYAAIAPHLNSRRYFLQNGPLH